MGMRPVNDFIVGVAFFLIVFGASFGVMLWRWR
jgi:hypothetical protein